MSLLCSCPVASEINDIPAPGCFEDFGQITGFILQRRYSSGTTENSFTIATANPNVLASWSALLSATDGTKVQKSPLLHGATLEPGEFRESGSGNDVAFGIPLFKGRAHASLTGMFKRERQDVILALKDYECETLSVYLVNESGWIAGVADDVTSATTFKGFPLSSFRVSDKASGGYDDVDFNNVAMNFYPNWSDYFYIVKPTNFNANTGLSGS